MILILLNCLPGVGPADEAARKGRHGFGGGEEARAVHLAGAPQGGQVGRLQDVGQRDDAGDDLLPALDSRGGGPEYSFKSFKFTLEKVNKSI